MGLSSYNIEALKPLFTPDDVVIVAPLNWGMGHASRCIPVIEMLSKYCKKVILASNGVALDLLTKEFPLLSTEELPSYDIKYKYRNILTNIIISTPTIVRAIDRERKNADILAKKHNATVILSDNRLGFRSRHTHNFYITHQMNLVHSSKLVAQIGTFIHRRFYSKFDLCLVPDYGDQRALAPDMSQSHYKNVIFVGPLTRINKISLALDNDILALLSGPEPQRTTLENDLVPLLSSFNNYKITLIRGTHKAAEYHVNNGDHLNIIDFATTDVIEYYLNRSRLLISRSGYSTIMDIHNLDIGNVFIPTPGQTEQEYLANHLSNGKKSIKLSQNKLEKLFEIIKYQLNF